MKALFKTIIKLGIVALVLYGITLTKPEEAEHKRAIAQKVTAQAENDPLLHAANLLHGVQDAAGVYPFEYKDYHLLSLMKDGSKTVSFGIFKRVFVLKNDFRS
ncbi:MAG: hypothetical protein JJU29_05490 [Verrucomicrobia bacterium]|nr:hypothetical protein [Verrucomicrobiota bacterium]MCH8512700.1 hypothetical protein [Kiritimatiellia bacterium]